MTDKKKTESSASPKHLSMEEIESVTGGVSASQVISDARDFITETGDKCIKEIEETLNEHVLSRFIQ